MPNQNCDDIIRYTEIVDVSPDVAFRAFAERFHEWWPPEFTFAASNLEYIGLEPHAGGRCIERSQDGVELTWGEVLRYEPPHRLLFSWWIQPDRTIDTDPENASEIEVTFIDEGSLTRVEFEHRHLSRHSGDWKMMREAMRSRQGWPLILQRYSDFANQ